MSLNRLAPCRTGVKQVLPATKINTCKDMLRGTFYEIDYLVTYFFTL